MTTAVGDSPALVVRPFVEEDMEWAETLIGAAFGGRLQARLGALIDALRFYQRRGFHIAEVRPGAVDEARRTLKPTIPPVGFFGIPVRDEVVLERVGRMVPG